MVKGVEKEGYRYTAAAPALPGLPLPPFFPPFLLAAEALRLARGDAAAAFEFLFDGE